MASYWKTQRIWQGRAPAPEQTVFTADGDTIVKEIAIANTDAANSVDVGVSVVPAGAAAGPANRVLPDTTVAPGELMLLSLSTVLALGDELSVRGSAADRATVTVSAVTRISA